MDDEKLIECVRRYSFLYDLSHPKYTDCIKKEFAWKEIANEVKQPTAACKQRWQSLRDCFRRALNKRRTKSGRLVKKSKKWKYEEEMGFLTPYFSKKNSLPSADISSEEEIVDTAVEENIYTEQSLDSSNSDAVAATDIAVAPVAITTRAASALAASTCRAVAKKHKNKRVKVPQTASSMLMSYSLEEKRKEATTSDYDELDHFFFNISATVRKFSPYQQAIAKNKIFSLVSNMEIQQFVTPNIDHTTSSPIPSPATTSWTLPASTPNEWKEEQTTLI